MWKLYRIVVDKASENLYNEDIVLKAQVALDLALRLLLNPAIATSVVGLLALFCLNFLSIKKRPYNIAYSARKPVLALLLTKWIFYGVYYCWRGTTVPYLRIDLDYMTIAEVLCLVMDVYFTVYPLGSMLRLRKVFKSKYDPMRILNTLVFGYMAYCVVAYSIFKAQLPTSTLLEISWIGYVGILIYVGIIYTVNHVIDIYSKQPKGIYVSKIKLVPLKEPIRLS